MIKIIASDVVDVIRQKIQSYDYGAHKSDVGTVIQVEGKIASISGLDNVIAGELLKFANGTVGIALELKNDNVSAAYK